MKMIPASAAPARVRTRLGNVTGRRSNHAAAAPAREPLRVGPRMAFLPCPRKNDRGARAARRKIEADDVAGSWPVSSGRRSHVGIIRPAGALRRHPGDVLIRVLDVAGFTVNAVLR